MVSLIVSDISQWINSYFEKVVVKNVHATIPKGNMGYDQYTTPDTVAVSVVTRKHTPMASRAILSNFFEEQ